jgi:ABC-type Fe3+/spermidine/putrescine transport system ATPase subunit
MAMDFQSYLLFPHLSVGGNIEFALGVRKGAVPSRDRRLPSPAITSVGSGRAYPHGVQVCGVDTGG